MEHFYGLEELKEDQTAQTQFQALKSRFQRDGIWPSIKANLVALVMYVSSDCMHMISQLLLMHSILKAPKMSHFSFKFWPFPHQSLSH